MKKHTLTAALAAILLLSLLLGGCGAAKSAEAVPADPAAAKGYMSAQSTYDMAEPMEEPAAEAERYDAGGVAVNGAAKAEDTSNAAPAGEMQAEKIIYNANAEIETIDYDATVQGIYDMVAQYGGFVQSSSVSGNGYYESVSGGRSYRRAYFTVRIPSESFKQFTSSLSTLGNVPSCSTSSENVTARYYDVQARMDAYKTQEARLLEMLEIAETVEDMLAIQQQLTEVQYEIDSLQSTLTNYDRQVNYSTVELNVREVEEYTETPVVVLSYWEKMRQGFARSLKSVGEFFSDLLLWLGSNLPALLVWVIVLAVLALLGRRWYFRRGERAQRRAQRRARRQAKREARRHPQSDAPAAPKDE